MSQDEATRRRTRRPAGVRPACRGVEHIGVLFVHGIGTQRPGETLAQWSRPLISYLQAWRQRHDLDGELVVQSQLDPASGKMIVELDIPPHRGLPHAHWLLTEADWAPGVQAPSFAEVFRWLGAGGATSRIAAFLRNRQGAAFIFDAPGSDASLDAARQGPVDAEDLIDAVESAASNQTPAGSDQALHRSRRGAIASAGAQSAGEALVSAMAGLGLACYGILRTVSRVIPAGPLRQNFLVTAADRFLLDWFGDVLVLLDDPVQSKAVTDRVARSVRVLLEDCEHVAVVAHSGGAIVTQQFLATQYPETVGRLATVLTFGQGLNLAWELIGAHGPRGAKAENAASSVEALEAKRRYPLLFGAAADPGNIFWLDVYATRDPAPSGPFRPPAAARVGPVISLPILNLASVRDDHGAYWHNNEQFLPLVAIALDSTSQGAKPPSGRGSRFSAGVRRRQELVQLRGQRVRVRLSWGLLVNCAAVSTIQILAFSYMYTGYGEAGAGQSGHPLRALGDDVGTALSAIPGLGALGDFLGRVQTAGAQFLQQEPGRSPLGWLAGASLIVVLCAAGFYLSLTPRPPWPLFERRAVETADEFDPWPIRGQILEVLARLWTGGWVVFCVVSLPAIPLLLLLAEALPEVDRSTGDLISYGVFAAVLLAGIALALVARRSLPKALARPARGRRGTAVLVSSGLLLVALATIAVTTAGVLLDPALGSLVLGAGTIALLFTLVSRVGRWRWNTWNEREQTSQAMGDQIFVDRWAATLQATGMLIVLTSLAIGLTWRVETSLQVSGLFLAGVILFGLADDALRIDPPHHSRRRRRNSWAGRWFGGGRRAH